MLSLEAVDVSRESPKSLKVCYFGILFACGFYLSSAHNLPSGLVPGDPHVSRGSAQRTISEASSGKPD